MTLKEIFSQLNISALCKKYRLPIWQCPHFLFLIMGILIIFIVLISYFISLHYIEEPEIIALITLFLSAILLIITFIIIRSFERLAEINRLRMEFTNIIIHQLSSPLTNISWLSEGLISGELENQIEYLKILKENSQKMRELIRDLVTVLKIEEESMPLKKEKISLVDIVNNLLLKFRPQISAKKLKIKFNFPQNLAKVLADPNQVEIVIENLLDNAISYSKEGGKIEIILKEKRKNIYFEIRDEGIGIPWEDQKYIFQKFFRAKNIISLQPYGSGLGLYITKSILNKLGGKIGFKSQEGFGSTFWFTLPIK